MKIKARKALAAIAALLLAASAAGCKKSDSSEESIPDDVMRQPFTFSVIEDDDDKIANDENDPALDQQDPTAPSATEGSSESDDPEIVYVEVTDASGEVMTQYVDVTEASGEKATEPNGEPKTQAVAVTEAIVSPTEAGASEVTDDPNNAPDPTEAPKPTQAVPDYKTGKIYWLDISKPENFTFNGDFCSAVFKISEDAPDGIYTVDVTSPDFANYDGETLMPTKVVSAKICVNKDAPAAEAAGDGFSVIGSTVSCKPGDTVTVNFSLSNNPGVCAVIFKFRFDRNIMNIVDCLPTGEFAEISGKSNN